ncbi:MAG: DNA polymerase I [Proteobacteria bacterium]|nr:DNA polymerase I [Pseudomonadota bacterium]MBU1687908.1 DNA polymerase I [Pseudomonadota bacterium]
MTSAEPVYLVDGSAYIYRAYHAIAPLSNSSGLPTHAVFGFINILLRVIREKNARYLAVAWDLRGPTFRHEIYDQYKANRPPMPDDLASQIPHIHDLVAAYNIFSLESQGYEADDLIASAALALADKGHQVVVVSGDKDLLQLVSKDISFWDPMNDRRFDSAAVNAKYGVEVDHLLDYFALVGDSSDNVPGVPGVGPKTAAGLISLFGSLDSLYQRIDEVDKPKLAEKLKVNREQAFLSRDLIRLKSDLPVSAMIKDYQLPEPNNDKLRELLTFLGFTKLLKSQVGSPALDRSGYRLIRDEAELAEVVTLLLRGPFVVIDTETTSLDPFIAELVGLSLCVSSDRAWYLPLAHRDSEGQRVDGQLDPHRALEMLRPLLEDPAIPKLGHNLKYDYQVLVTQGIRLAGKLWDTMIASYLLDPARRSHGLDDLCHEILQVRLTSFAEVTGGEGKGSGEANFALVAPPAARDYSCEDVHGTLLLWEAFRPRLEEFELWKLFDEVETALVPVLATMERNGILVDKQVLQGLTKEFGHELSLLEEETYRLAGESFNINSPKQLGQILFEKLKLPQGRKTKTGYSTDVRVLEKLSVYHDLPAVVVNYRNLTKLKSTYVDKLLELIHPSDQRIHSSFNQTVTATGRLSSTNPNLQNIPIRTEEGRRIRQCFVAAPGHLLLAADYSQIDLRVLAHYSGDHALLEAFQSGQDVHRQTAIEVFRVSSGFVTSQMRRVAKTINFGIVYGMSAFGLSEQLNLSRKEAQTFIDRYFEHYAGVKRFMEEIVEQAREDGFVTTLLNRRRFLPDITSSNKTRREFAERTAINTPIQGTAADIIKLATIRVDQRLREAGLSGRLLLQIHDELVFEVASGEVGETEVLVKEAMESVIKLEVPLVVNLASGGNLAET